jgi:hypothetical protein
MVRWLAVRLSMALPLFARGFTRPCTLTFDESPQPARRYRRGREETEQ